MFGLRRMGCTTCRSSTGLAVRPSQFYSSSVPNAGLIKYALVDIDGTLTQGPTAFPGVADALNRLRDCTTGVRLVTNQSQEPSHATWTRLQAAGFEVEPRDVFSALCAARQLVERKGLRPLCLLSDSALEQFKDVPSHDPNAVLVGTAPAHFHYERLTEALRALLHDEESAIIAVNKGRYFMRDDGFALQAGAFVAALEYASNKEAVVVGKPSRDFFHAAAASVSGLDVEECPLGSFVMIGDDAVDDVQGAMDAGMQAILVRTGKYRAGDEARCRTPPLAVVDDLSAAIEFLRDNGCLDAS